MSFISNYIEADYEVTKYSSGGSVRERLTGNILASYTNFWTPDGSVHPETQDEIEHIKEKLGITITPKQ